MMLLMPFNRFDHPNFFPQNEKATAKIKARASKVHVKSSASDCALDKNNAGQLSATQSIFIVGESQ